MNKTIEIPAKVIRGAMVCQATNDVRIHLNAVLFDGDNGKVVASDGSILFISEVESLKGAFSGTRILKIPQKIPKAIEFVDLDIADNALWLKKNQYDDELGYQSLQRIGVKFNCKVIDAKPIPYGDFETNIDESTVKPHSVGLKPRLVKRALKALRDVKGFNHVWDYAEGYVTVSTEPLNPNPRKVIILPIRVDDNAN